MRTLAITQNITVDGAIEMLGDWFDPTAEVPRLTEELMRQSAAEDVLLVGRQTFEDLRGYWPGQLEHDTTGVAAHLERVHKVVVSTTLGEPGWDPTTVLSGPDWPARVRDLKEEDGGDIVVTGSVSLCPALLEHSLVDELRLFTYPVVQGRGRRLFPDGWTADLELTDQRVFERGITLRTYGVRRSA